MKSKEFILEAKKPKVTTPKPRNFVAKNAPKAGAGAHKNKKKAAKQGEVKHKSQMAEGNEPDEGYLDKVISDLHKDALGMRPDREFGREWMSSSYEEKLEIYNNMLKNLHNDMDEATGDEKFDTMMRTIKKGTKKQATTDRREREAESRPRARDAFGPSPADKLSIRPDKDVGEGIGGTIAGGVGQFIGNKIDPLAGEIMRAHGEIAGRKAEYTIRKYMHLLQKALKQQLDSGEKEGVAEGGDVFYNAGETANKKPVGKGTTVKNKITGIVGKAYSWSVVKGVPYLYVKGDDDRYQSPAKDWLVVDEQGVEEGSDWGEPREILEDVLQTLEREVEWPLTEVMDPKQVRQLLSPLVRAVNAKLLSMDRDGNQ